MAGKTAILSIRIISDAKNAITGLDKTAGRMDKFREGSRRAAVAATAVGVGLLAIGKSALDNANALQQSTGATTSVFGDQAAAIQKLAGNASTAVGLSQNSYQELASVLGSQLGNMGVAEQKLVGTTDDLITKGADLAATFGGTTAEAVAALSSLMRGEADPIERYGVSIKQSDVNARLAAQGLSGLTGAELKQAETAAKLALLTEQTAAATGQFARETGSAAGSQQIATAAWEDATAQLGTALLPAMTTASQILAQVAGWVQQNSAMVQAMAVVLGIATVAVIALNLALSLNPISLVVIAIAALIAGLVIAYHKIGWVQTAINFLGDVASTVWNWMVDGLTNVILWINRVLEPVGGIQGAIDLLGSAAGIVWQGIQDGISGVVSWCIDAYNWVNKLINAFKDSALGKGLGAIGGAIGGLFKGAAAQQPATMSLLAAPSPAAMGLTTTTAQAQTLTAAPSPRTMGSLSTGNHGGPGVTNHYNVEVKAGIGDPVAIGKEIDSVLTKFHRATGKPRAA